MKHLLVSFFFFLLCYNVTEAQTYANIPGPENVLVVYNSLNQTSIDVKAYYQTARSIPTSNIKGLNIPTSAYNGAVQLEQEGEVIRRMGSCSDYGSNGVCDTLAWYYFEEYIAGPIRNHLNNMVDPNTGEFLFNQIRYIVLCKGIPLKLWSQDPAWHEWGANISVDALLSILNTNGNNNQRPVAYYYPNNNAENRKTNPYHGKDQMLTMEYRFLPNTPRALMLC